MKVHLLHGGFDFEGSRVLAAYADETVAKETCEKLEKHKGTAPEVEDAATYQASYTKWTKECPLEGAAHYDYYHVRSMEVI